MKSPAANSQKRVSAQFLVHVFRFCSFIVSSGGLESSDRSDSRKGRRNDEKKKIFIFQ